MPSITRAQTADRKRWRRFSPSRSVLRLHPNPKIGPSARFHSWPLGRPRRFPSRPKQTGDYLPEKEVVILAVTARGTRRQVFVRCPGSRDHDGIEVEEVFVPILSLHAPSDNEVELIARSRIFGLRTGKFDHANGSVTTKTVISNLLKHAVNKGMTNREEFGLGVANRLGAIKRNSFEAFLQFHVP